MKNLCPDCHSELTPSIVGYMCHNCGAVHDIDKIANASPSSKLIKKTSSFVTKEKSQFDITPKKTLMTNGDIKPNKLKHKLHRFVVPKISELPKPVDESHLLEASYPPGDEDISQLPLGQPSEETPTPVINEDVSRLAPDKDLLDETDILDSEDTSQGSSEVSKLSEHHHEDTKPKNNLASKILLILVILFVVVSLFIYFSKDILNYYQLLKK